MLARFYITSLWGFFVSFFLFFLLPSCQLHFICFCHSLSRNLNMYLLYTKREYTKQVIIKIHKSTLSKYKYYISFDKEGNVLFNDALDTFLIRLYGVGRMVRDHSDSERGNPLHGLLFSISSKGSFICII